MMVSRFYPKKYADSAYELPYEAFYKKGIRGVIFDVDNTLTLHGAPAGERSIELFKRLREVGLNTCLLSNNKEQRVKSFAQEVGTEYIYKAGKPRVSGYVKAMEKMGTDKATTVFVGDQLFTDVYGANRAGIYSILVKPIHPKEEIQIILKRYPEKMVLYFYRRKLKKEKRKNSGN